MADTVTKRSAKHRKYFRAKRWSLAVRCVDKLIYYTRRLHQADRFVIPEINPTVGPSKTLPKLEKVSPISNEEP